MRFGSKPAGHGLKIIYLLDKREKRCKAFFFCLNSDLVNRGLDYAARERIISFTNGYTAVTAGVIYASEIVAESADIYATVYINDINLWSFNGYLIHKRIPVPPLPLTAGDTIKIIITGTASSNGGYFIPYK